MSSAALDEALWDLDHLARARGLCDWMFEQYAPYVGGRVAEVGSGIGTFSERILAAGVDDLLAVEPDPVCVARLEARFGADPRVEVAQEALPDSPALAAREGALDFVVSQNVFEHIPDHDAAAAAAARALRPGGRLTLLVPAHPRLFGPLDRKFEHQRRYTRASLRALVEGAGLEVLDLHSFNLLGIPGWWVQNRRDPSLGTGSLRAYEALLRVWRPLERRARPPWGLSVIVHARRPS